jgi:hypothetical protein
MIHLTTSIITTPLGMPLRMHVVSEIGQMVSDMVLLLVFVTINLYGGVHEIESREQHQET